MVTSMVPHRATLCLALLLTATGFVPSNGLIEEIATGLEFVIHTIEGISETWELVESHKAGNQHQQPNFPLIKRKQNELMSRLVEIYREIENIEHEVKFLEIFSSKDCPL